MANPLNSQTALDFANNLWLVDKSDVSFGQKITAFRTISTLHSEQIRWGFRRQVLIYCFEELVEDPDLKKVLDEESIQVVKLSQAGFCANVELLTSAEKVYDLFTSLMKIYVDIYIPDVVPPDDDESIPLYVDIIQKLWEQYALDAQQTSTSPELNALKEQIQALINEKNLLRSKVENQEQASKSKEEETNAKVADLKNRIDKIEAKQPKNALEALGMGIARTANQEFGCSSRYNFTEDKTDYSNKEAVAIVVSAEVGIGAGFTTGLIGGAALGSPLGPLGSTFGAFIGGFFGAWKGARTGAALASNTIHQMK